MKVLFGLTFLSVVVVLAAGDQRPRAIPGHQVRPDIQGVLRTLGSIRFKYDPEKVRRSHRRPEQPHLRPGGRRHPSRFNRDSPPPYSQPEQVPQTEPPPPPPTYPSPAPTTFSTEPPPPPPPEPTYTSAPVLEVENLYQTTPKPAPYYPTQASEVVEEPQTPRIYKFRILDAITTETGASPSPSTPVYGQNSEARFPSYVQDSQEISEDNSFNYNKGPVFPKDISNSVSEFSSSVDKDEIGDISPFSYFRNTLFGNRVVYPQETRSERDEPAIPDTSSQSVNLHPALTHPSYPQQSPSAPVAPVSQSAPEYSQPPPSAPTRDPSNYTPGTSEPNGIRSYTFRIIPSTNSPVTRAPVTNPPAEDPFYDDPPEPIFYFKANDQEGQEELQPSSYQQPNDQPTPSPVYYKPLPPEEPAPSAPTYAPAAPLAPEAPPAPSASSYTPSAPPAPPTPSAPSYLPSAPSAPTYPPSAPPTPGYAPAAPPASPTYSSSEPEPSPPPVYFKYPAQESTTVAPVETSSESDFGYPAQSFVGPNTFEIPEIFRTFLNTPPKWINMENW